MAFSVNYCSQDVGLAYCKVAFFLPFHSRLAKPSPSERCSLAHYNPSFILILFCTMNQLEMHQLHRPPLIHPCPISVLPLWKGYIALTGFPTQQSSNPTCLAALRCNRSPSAPSHAHLQHVIAAGNERPNATRADLSVPVVERMISLALTMTLLRERQPILHAYLSDSIIWR